METDSNKKARFAILLRGAVEKDLNQNQGFAIFLGWGVDKDLCQNSESSLSPLGAICFSTSPTNPPKKHQMKPRGPIKPTEIKHKFNTSSFSNLIGFVLNLFRISGINLSPLGAICFSSSPTNPHKKQMKPGGPTKPTEI